MTTRRPGFLAAASLSSNQVGQVNPGAHRYWRVLAVSTQAGGTGANDNFAVAEIGMRPFINGTNIALGQTYASSSSVGVGFEAAEAFDSNPTTFLDTADATDGWVSVDFGAGSDAEVHELTFTNVPNATRKCPAEIRVQYSDDAVLWVNAFIITPDPWTDTQETRVFTAGYAVSQYSTTNFADAFLPELSCVGAWGTILRNHGYTGPAMRVEDNANPGTTTDVFFDGNGFLRGPTPYGDDTRVVILYDQFGTSDLFATTGDNIRIEINGIEYVTWRMQFGGNGELTSTVLTGDVAATWEIDNLVWAAGFKRRQSSIFRTIWGVPSTSVVMETGLFQNDEDLNWRVNGSSGSNWIDTDWELNSGIVQVEEVERVIGDMSSGSPAQGWYKGVSASSRTYSAPIVYSTGQPLNIGGGVSGSDYNGEFFELAIFNPSQPLPVSVKDALDDALSEGDFFVTGQESVVFEHRAMAIFGAPRRDSVNTKSQRLHAILGVAQDQITSREQRLHAIIVP